MNYVAGFGYVTRLKKLETNLTDVAGNQLPGPAESSDGTCLCNAQHKLGRSRAHPILGTTSP